MEQFEMYLPTRIQFGNGKAQLVGEKAKVYGSKVFLVMDPFFKDHELGGKIIEKLKASKLDVVKFYDVLPNPRSADIDNAADICRKEKCEVVVGVGGGSALDTAKTVAWVAKFGGSCWDYTEREGEDVKKPNASGLPCIAIPTTSGTGTEATIYTVVNNTKVKSKNTIASEFILPTISLVDPEMTITMPRKATALCGIDAFTHCFESYTDILSNTYSEMICLEGMRHFVKSIRECCLNSTNLDARGSLSWCSTLGGIAISIVPPTLTHALGQPLGGMTDAPHGGTIAACLPEIIEWTLPVCQEKYAIVAQMFDDSLVGKPVSYSASRLPIILDDLFKEIIGEDVTFSSYGLKEENFDDLVNLIIKTQQLIIHYHPKRAERKDIYDIIRMCM